MSPGAFCAGGEKDKDACQGNFNSFFCLFNPIVLRKKTGTNSVHEVSNVDRFSTYLVQTYPASPSLVPAFYTDKKEKKIFLKYMEIQMGPVAKSYMRKSFPIYEEMRKYLTIYEEAASHI